MQRRFPFSTQSLGVSVVLLAAAGLSAQQATYRALAGVSSANDITPDGSIVVGSGPGGGYYWRWQVEPAPTFIGGRDAVAVSDDGSVIVGCIIDPGTGREVAGRWTQATGWQNLGYLPRALSCPSRSNAYDVSGDGEIVVGLSWDGCSGRGFMWTQANGMEELQVLGNGGNRASVIAGNGSLIGGFAQGFSRTPALWQPDLSGRLYNINDVGEVYGISEDGNDIVGSYNGRAFHQQGGGKLAFFPLLNPGWSGIAMDRTDAGTIYGFDINLGAREAWVWDAAGGTRKVTEELTSRGATGVPRLLEVCSAVSCDGSVLIGHGFGGAWLATWPVESVVAEYGCGVNPPGSLSVVAGEPRIGASITLGVDNPLGTQTAGATPVLLLAAQPWMAFPCGTSVPGWGMAGSAAPGELLVNPVGLLQLIGPSWTGAGNPAPITFGFPAISGLIGLSIYGQGVMVDPLSANTIGLSSALDLTIGG